MPFLLLISAVLTGVGSVIADVTAGHAAWPRARPLPGCRWAVRLAHRRTMRL